MREWQEKFDQLKTHLYTWLAQWHPSAKKSTEENHESPINSPNQAAKLVQRRLFVVVGGVLIVILILVMSLQKPKAKQESPSKVSTVQEASFTSPIDNLDEQSVWIARAENKLKNEQKNTGDLQKMVLKQAVSVQAQNDVMAAQQQTISQLSQQVAMLASKLDTLQTKPISTPSNSANAAFNTANAQPLISGMTVTTLSLAPLPVQVAPPVEKTPDTYVPANSYVQAVMIEGIDASTGVSSQSDPRPVLLRTVDVGTLPNGYHSHLKNCRLNGAGYGDLSSERVFIRLESMSCIRDGVAVDMPVYGYVSGPDGKAGIHGKVVMRDGELVAKGFIGGALSGFSDSASNNYTTTSVSPLGSTTSVNNGQNLEYATAQGVSSAADLYAQYNIKRAEQLQPVIEVGAGTIVDVVFNKGFYLNGQEKQDAPSPSVSSSPSSKFVVSQTNAPTPANIC